MRENSAKLQQRVEELRNDYRRETGVGFEYFYCPILCADMDGDLCAGHIVPQAFEGSHGPWTAQREDVDNYFGHAFEGRFADLKLQGTTADAALADYDAAKKLRLTIMHGDEVIPFYPVGKNINPNHTVIEIQTGSGAKQWILKISPEEFRALAPAKLDIQIGRDLSLASAVSILKAAHLTLFHILGYRYALSTGGRFVGLDILAPLFSRHTDATSPRAVAHMNRFANMIRPLLDFDDQIRGTVESRFVHICETIESRPWAFMVFVRAGTTMHACIIPIMSDGETAARFHRFLECSESQNLIGRPAIFGDQVINASRETKRHSWGARESLGDQ